MNSQIYLAILFFALSCRLSYTNAQFRMINGKDTDIRESPYTVAIYFCSKYACTGSLVTLKSVVTAAHCVTGKPWSHLEVQAGAAKISSLITESVQHRNVQNVILGDGYTETLPYMDIAVVKLEGPFNSGVTVEPVSLCDCILRPGISMDVRGWGDEEASYNPSKNYHLKTAEMITMRKDECQHFYGNIGEALSLPDTIICARGSGSTTSEKDAGAGAIVRKRLCALALGSCQNVNIPTLFTDLSNAKVMQFLTRNINFNE